MFHDMFVHDMFISPNLDGYSQEHETQMGRARESCRGEHFEFT